jgi:hypothetical protein
MPLQLQNDLDNGDIGTLKSCLTHSWGLFMRMSRAVGNLRRLFFVAHRSSLSQIRPPFKFNPNRVGAT